MNTRAQKLHGPSLLRAKGRSSFLSAPIPGTNIMSEGKVSRMTGCGSASGFGCHSGL